MLPKTENPIPANDNEPISPPVVPCRSRNCLNCGARFRSLGPFNRICDACKADEIWQSGEDFVLELPPRRKMVD